MLSSGELTDAGEDAPPDEVITDHPSDAADAGERDVAAIEAIGVRKEFASDREGPFVALESVSLAVDQGEFVALVGPSGCGKSTFLNMAAGLVAPTAGTLRFMGRELAGVNTGVGYMAQGDTLLPWSTVRKNVALGLEVQRIGTKAERAERVERILEEVGLDGFADRFPSQLSGGMRKRATLARTLVYQPPALLMDEPFSALDAQMRTDLQGQLLDLWSERRCTVCFVTHDLDEALLLSDRVVVFGTKPGRVLEVVDNPLPRPRSVEQLRTSPDFAGLWQHLWGLIRGAGGPIRPKDAP
jgi:NitT/TauT family transport system ATP-binding protein